MLTNVDLASASTSPKTRAALLSAEVGALGAPTTSSRLIQSGALTVNNGVDVEQSSSSSAAASPGTCMMPPHSAGMMPQEGIDELGPVSRDRCNTWPLRRSQLDINAQTSPLIHEQIPEEEAELVNFLC